MVTSQIDLESSDDKSKVALFVKHHSKIDLKNTLKRGHVLLVKEAYRKISNQLDIYTQLTFSRSNFMVIGKVQDQNVTDWQANNRISLIKMIPTDSIIRSVIKVLGFIVEMNFVKIQYKCDVCKQDIQNENVCRSGCFIKNP